MFTVLFSALLADAECYISISVSKPLSFSACMRVRRHVWIDASHSGSDLSVDFSLPEVQAVEPDRPQGA